MIMRTNSIKMIVKRCLMLAAVLTCASCSTCRDSVSPSLYGHDIYDIYVLRWEDYNGLGDPDKAKFYLDEVPMGTGEHGIKKVLETLEYKENGGFLIVSWRQHDMRGGGHRYDLPYDGLGYHLRMQRLLRKKEIIALNIKGEYAFKP